jgi:hypothetical protein
VKEERFTICLAIYFWNLEFRKVHLNNRTTGNPLFIFRFKFMDRSFSTPASFTGDFWVAGFGVSYLVTKVQSWLAANLLQNTLSLIGWHNSKRAVKK